MNENLRTDQLAAQEFVAVQKSLADARQVLRKEQNDVDITHADNTIQLIHIKAAGKLLANAPKNQLRNVIEHINAGIQPHEIVLKPGVPSSEGLAQAAGD